MKARHALISAVALLFVPQALAGGPPRVDKIGVYDLSSQRLSGSNSVVVRGGFGFSALSILVTVDTDGKVVDAELAHNFHKLDPKPGLAAAKQWTFRPQTFDGHPVQAVGTVQIYYEAPEIPADASVPFPSAPLKDVEIVLERSSCFGSCPDYRVSVRGDGRVRFSSEGDFPGSPAEEQRTFGGGVLWPGTHEASVDPQAVAKLLGRFRDANFMGLRSAYVSDITDNATYALTLRVGRTTKRVTNYLGRTVGMPKSVSALEDAVDELAQTDRWVAGNVETISLLKHDGFDFRSKKAADLALIFMIRNRWACVGQRAIEFLRAAIAAGLDLDHSTSWEVPGEPRDLQPLGALMAAYAAEIGSEDLFDEMARRGYVARMSKRARDSAFTSGAGCSVKIAKALVAAGTNPKAQTRGGNALSALRRGSGRCSDISSQTRVEMAQVLIGLGVAIEARDDLGWTPLMGCNDPEVAKVLLAAGANPNASDTDGTTPLLSIDDDRVAMLLLRAGADPHAKDKDGTVRDQARTHHWPATLAWLDAHGIP